MHIQRTKTLDKAFGSAPKQQRGYNNYTDFAGYQPNSKPPVKKKTRTNQSQIIFTKQSLCHWRFLLIITQSEVSLV